MRAEPTRTCSPPISPRARGPAANTPSYADAWIPTDAIKGELAESWEVQKEPLAVIFKLKKGIMFPAKPGIMEARELTADDVVFSWYYRHNSPKRQAGLNEEFSKVAALDRYTVAFYMSKYMSDWPYRLGYGYNASIMPKEVGDAGAGDWKNINGSGPFMITDYVAGNSHTYSKRPDYWDKEKIGEAEFKLPFVDKVVYRVIRDESTRVTALRTGKLDIMEYVSWENVDTLKKSAPDLKWKQWVSFYGTMMVLRTDQKPFDDIRVRRALNMAVNKDEIIKSFYNGNAELFAYPMHPAYEGYYEPLSAMPDSVKELFTYNPEKAKKLLAEAGYPNGFTFKVQASAANPGHLDLLPHGGGLSRAGGRQDRNPADGVCGLPLGDEQQDAHGRLLHEHRPQQSADRDPQELHHRAALEPVDVVRPRLRQQDGIGRSGAGRGEAQGPDPRIDARNPRQGAAHLDADGQGLHRLVAMGEEL